MKNVILLAFLAFVDVYVLFSNASDGVVVTTPLGRIRGRERITANGVTFYSYQGIPYAEPPIGKLRFLAPIWKKPWNVILDATEERNSCFQINNSNELSNEDCLFINVFTPKSPSNHSEGLAVIFYIHGGGFMDGSATEEKYGPDHLMEKDVVLVTLNYRLGAFGFLTNHDAVIPGNAGLKDQVLALNWTRSYIEFFGGDLTKITIFGHEAGAASVGLHILSPLSKGLFRAAISFGGSVLSPFAYQKSQVAFTRKMPEYVDPKNGKSINTPQGILTFLQSQSAEVIQEAALNLTKDIERLTYPGYVPLEKGSPFGPVMERPLRTAFLADRQYELLVTGSYKHVPLLTGFTASEALFYLDDEHIANNMADNLDRNPDLLIPDDMSCSKRYRGSIRSMILDFYAHQSTIYSNLTSLVKFASDQIFNRPILKQAQLQSEHSLVYFYNWRYLGPLGGKCNTSEQGFSDQTSHGEELGYIFCRNYSGYDTRDWSQFSDTDQLVADRFLTMITDFAKHMYPTPWTNSQQLIWPWFNDTGHYLDIGSEMVVRLYPKWDQFMFWENVYSYGTRPFNTY